MGWVSCHDPKRDCDANVSYSPVLVNVSSFRCIIGFAMSFRATEWINDRGFFGSFGIYAAVLAGLSMLLPVMYLYGKKIRKWTAGTVRNTNECTYKVEMQTSYMDF